MSCIKGSNDEPIVPFDAIKPNQEVSVGTVEVLIYNKLRKQLNNIEFDVRYTDGSGSLIKVTASEKLNDETIEKIKNIVSTITIDGATLTIDIVHDKDITIRLSQLSSAMTTRDKLEVKIAEGIVQLLDLKKLKQSLFTSGAYPTGWAARIPNPNDMQKPLFPKHLEWLVNNQHKEGFFGEPNIVNYHNRIMGTLSAIVALKKWNTNNQYDEFIKNGEEYITENIAKIEGERYKPVGFGQLFTALMNTAKEQELNLPYDHEVVTKTQSKRDSKMKLVFGKKYDELTKEDFIKVFKKMKSIGFSSECFYGDERVPKMKRSQNGSVSNSLSATAAMVIQEIKETGSCDPTSIEFIENATIKDENGDSVAHSRAPNFIIAFVLMYLVSAGVLKKGGKIDDTVGIDSESKASIEKKVRELLEYLKGQLTDGGLPFAEGFGVPDLDDTGAALYVMFSLLSLDELDGISASTLLNFVTKNGIVNYPEQMAGSCTPICSFVIALHASPSFEGKDKLIERAFNEIIKKIHPDLKNPDKLELSDQWVLTDYYTASRLPFYLYPKKYASEMKGILKYVKSKQNEDGSWGTEQETAYALKTIMKNDPNKGKDTFTTLKKAAEYLAKFDSYESKDDPMWLCNHIYDPKPITLAAKLSAYFMLLQTEII